MEINYNLYKDILEPIKYSYDKLRKTTDNYYVLFHEDDETLINQLKVILPYYISELKDSSFYRKTIKTKGILTRSLFVYPIIKALLHLRLFQLDLEKVDEIYSTGLRCNNEIHLANEILCFDVLFITYGINPHKLSPICEQHIMLTRDTYINYLYRFRDSIHNISVDYIDAIMQQIDMVHESITAPLTDKLLNRTGFFAFLNVYVSSYDIIGLLSLDIDHFKQVNDHQGHDAGDECLIAVGNCLAKISEDYNGIGTRAGGEEFFMAFPGINEETLKEITQKINELMHGIKREVPENCEDFLPHMSASIGAGIWDKNEISFIENSTFKELFGQLDKAVYESKKTRNQTTIISFHV